MNTKVKHIAYVGIMAALMAVCSWISIPTAVPFTLQTFAVFFAVGMLGGRDGTLSVLVYILLGAVGVPVFAGFSGGIGALGSMSGGYIIGFIFTALIMWGMEKAFGKKAIVFFLSALLGLAVCYGFGTVWYWILYTKNTEPVGIMTVLGWCVFPFILPDFIKIGLAYFLSSRIAKAVHPKNGD